MDAIATLRTMMDCAGLSVRGIAEKLGKTPYYMKHTLYRNGKPSVSNFSKMADVCGYDLLVRNRGDGSEIVIEPND